MNPLSQLNSRMASSFMPSSTPPNKPALTGQALQSGSDILAKRNQELGNVITDLAQNLMQNFAKQMFGDAAKSMTFSFDKTELSSSSNFAATAQQSADGSAAAFRLEDSSHFNGKGKLYTADGRQFDFEIDVRYKSIVEAASASTATQQPSQPNTSPSSALSRINQQFAGTAEDLLKHLSSKPSYQPFQLLKQSDDGQSLLKLLGEMSMQLLNLPGGPRHLDLSNKAAEGHIQEQA
ncbi:hypothetical protein [Iodobacter fluviatilis]|uniref:Uncharacterized protein n=1 Tax=Iodobacter fluviatilis TaxID=537 RepID=A0A7G3G8A4_9NEIS|nr:hypothetical protein [Iodobacter fluviatilis]QBC43466.1 hypothetical protein C1H71_07875 [Iodobacter fluviatilis]